jgi:S1-C subfamily serine protease
VNLLDLILLVLLVVGGLNGFRRGAALQVTTYIGLLVGLLVGALIAPRLARLFASPLTQAAVAIMALVVIAGLGDALGWFVGTKIWATLRRSALSSVDAVAGAVIAVVAALLAIWFVGLNLANGPLPSLSREIRGSVVVRALDRTLPRPPSMLSQIQHFLNRFDFPAVFADLPPAPAGAVKGPSNAQVSAVASEAEPSTVRIVGQACRQIQEGSGFVAAPNYVITNAHVVAGVHGPSVQQQNGGSEPSVVVVFDPKLDIAILRVGRTPGPVLSLDQRDENRGATGAVLGYPGGGGLKFGAAAVRRELKAIGRDIYGRSIVVRNVYELQAIVRPGNSGGPFVLENGTVGGVVFAASTTDPNVGYAIAAPQVLPELQQARSRTTGVDTGPCVR